MNCTERMPPAPVGMVVIVIKGVLGQNGRAFLGLLSGASPDRAAV